MSQSRQLAAIMFTDIVGYTALMGEDEQRAFELLKINREIQKPLIKHFNGTWIKELGDGVLASFHTVTDAVFCAAAIHQASNKVESLKLRIGIHLGEVIFEGNDVFGDGVNIASRLQALALPGSTWVSEAVYKNLINKKEIGTTFIKEENLKNVSEPVRVYEITVKEIPGYLPDNIKAYRHQGQSSISKNKRVYIAIFIVLAVLTVSWWLFFNQKKETSSVSASANPEKSIAVLPFMNMSDDPQQEYFSDGLSEELINMFTRLPELKVIGRTSSFAFKGKNEDLRTIGEKLGVKYLLEGSVRKSGNTIRITTQLIKASDGSHIWSETYDKVMDDIFEVQDQISSSVTNALKVTLLNKDKPSTQFKTNPDAYNDFLQGRFIYESYNESHHNEMAMAWFREAVKKDSSFSLAWTYLSMIYWRQASNSKQAEFREAKEAAFRALELDPLSAIAAANVAEILDNEFDFYGALDKIKLALKLEPESPYVLRNAGRFYTYLGRHEESIDFCKRALQNDPIQRSAQGYLANAYFYAEQYDKALEVLKGYREKGGFSFVDKEYFDMLIHTSNLEEALKEVVRETRPGWKLYKSAVLHAKKGNKNESAAALTQLAEKNPDMPYVIALAYTHSGDYEKAIDWLEIAYINKDKEMVNVNAEPLFRNLKKNERFNILLQKMNFPK
jgi:TolB-like protein/class 3 adenylate cyclase